MAFECKFCGGSKPSSYCPAHSDEPCKGSTSEFTAADWQDWQPGE